MKAKMMPRGKLIESWLGLTICLKYRNSYVSMVVLCHEREYFFFLLVVFK